MPVPREALVRALGHTLEGTNFKELSNRYEGKVRDNYRMPTGERAIIVTDRVSAFDRVLGTLPFKGQVLNSLASWWFRKTRDLAPNHFISQPDPNITIATECEPIAAEFVVRSYLTGVTSTSVWTHYNAGAREFCGHKLPDGLRKNQALPEAILTPSTKAEKGGHDVSVSRADLLASGKVSARDFDEAAEIAHALFAFGRAWCTERGLMLVDTKYEFGKTKDGRVMVIDEIHTPDSTRYWLAGSYAARMEHGEEPESFDKEYLRRWLAASGFTGEGRIPAIADEVRVEAAARYIDACETIWGEPFVPDAREPIARMRKNLNLPEVSS